MQSCAEHLLTGTEGPRLSQEFCAGDDPARPPDPLHPRPVECDTTTPHGVPMLTILGGLAKWCCLDHALPQIIRIWPRIACPFRKPFDPIQRHMAL